MAENSPHSSLAKELEGEARQRQIYATAVEIVATMGLRLKPTFDEIANDKRVFVQTVIGVEDLAVQREHRTKLTDEQIESHPYYLDTNAGWKRLSQCVGAMIEIQGT